MTISIFFRINGIILPPEKTIVMNLNFQEILTASMVLFAVIDIIGNIPIIIGLREKAGHLNSRRASIIAAVVMIIFLFLGERILSLIGVNLSEFAVAGSFILFAIALEMILGVSLFKDADTSPKVATVFPLAFPLLAGPGSLSTLIFLRAEYFVENIIVAILINTVIIYVILKSSSRLERFLGKNGIVIIQKIFGVILLAIAVKLFTSNIQVLFGN